jgi:hypothetical protein
MAAKSSPISAADAQFIGEQLGLELHYAKRDATTTRIGNQAKSASKLRFDRDRYARMQVICAAFTALTGIKPIERPQQDIAGFMSRLGATLDVPAEQPMPQSDTAPWDMNF